MCYFTWKQELVLNILWVIVGSDPKKRRTPGCRKIIRRPHNVIYQHWKSVKKRLGSKPSEKVVIEAF